MSRYMMIRRLRGPLFLLLVGVNALLAQADILGWGKSWPLYLILAGVLSLAERAAMASETGYPPQPYPGPYQAPYQQGPYQGSYQAPNPYPANPGSGPTWTDAANSGTAASTVTETGTEIVPSLPHDLVKDPRDTNGGKYE
jgi:hypothetical protein